MDDLETLLLALVLAGLAIVIFLLLRRKPAKEDSSLMMLQQQLGQVAESLERQSSQMNKTLDSKLSESTKAMQSQFSESSKIVRDVTERLTKLDDTNKQVVGFAEQLQSLENILKNPKHRGVLGEYYLKILLENVFSPDQYKMQYKFKDGQIVDAVIFVKEGMIPIDSKFSLENYNRIVDEKDSQRKEELEKIFIQDLKNRIEETAKYVRPNEGTLEFAFMFIPGEAIYYDLLVNNIGAIKGNARNLIEYANREKNVHIVSPHTFSAYIQTILKGLQAMRIEDSVKEIIKKVIILKKHLGAHEEYLEKLGNNIDTTVNTYNNTYKEFGKIDKDITKITNGRSEVKVKQIEKTKKEEL